MHTWPSAIQTDLHKAALLYVFNSGWVHVHKISMSFFFYVLQMSSLYWGHTYSLQEAEEQ